MGDKAKIIEEFRSRMADLAPLEDEPDFVTSNETLVRFLKSRDWKLKDAEELLRETVKWRREKRPLLTDCTWCHEKPGFHSMRQVGFDMSGRPVMYANFNQACTRRNSVDDTIDHVTYLIENAKRTMKSGIHTWVWIIDCSGISLPSCNPRLGYGVTQIMSNFYPERLGLVICLNHSSMFQGVWNAIKVFLHPNTVSKMKLVRSKKKILDTFEKYFPEDLTRWLLDEIKSNKHRPIPHSQREFWKAPVDPFTHDPRGCPSYVENFVDLFPVRQRDDKDLHRPHPNIVDFLLGKEIKVGDPSPVLPHVSSSGGISDGSKGSGGACKNNDEEFDDVDDEEAETLQNLDIAEEYQVPKDAKPIY